MNYPPCFVEHEKDLPVKKRLLAWLRVDIAPLQLVAKLCKSQSYLADIQRFALSLVTLSHS